jgi:tetratricopeptide (TPR) repeat protein
MNINKVLQKASNSLVLKQYQQCISTVDKVIALDPINIQALLIRSEAFLRLEEYQKALPDLAKVIEIDNKNLKALNNFAVALLKEKKYHESKDIFEYLLELDPKNLNAKINLCNIFQALNEPENALRTAFSAIEIDLTSAPAFNNLGTALGELSMSKEAREAYLTAVQLDPNYLPAIINLAEVEAKFENFNKSIELYEKILSNDDISKNERDLINYYVSYSYLAVGNLVEGWRRYEFGLNPYLLKGAQRSTRKFHQKRWDESLSELGTLLIWTEQGIGDEVLFSTCLNDLYDSELKVIVECDHRMVAIYQRTYPRFQFRPQLVGLDGYPILNDFDFHCPIGSLPKVFRQSFNDFNRVKRKFVIDIEKDNLTLDLLSKYKNKKLVGISWRSGVLNLMRNESYSSLLDWKDLLLLEDCQFVNLQYGDCEQEITLVEEKLGIKILRWKDIDLKNDLEMVFALINKLDFVVSVDTAASVFSGILNVKTFLLMRKTWVLLGQTFTYPWFECVKPYIVEKDNPIAYALTEVISDLKFEI